MLDGITFKKVIFVQRFVWTMEKMQSTLPFYTEINDFLASIPWPSRTENPDFYCLRLKPLDGPKVSVYRPPFKRAFYFFALLFNSGKVNISYGQELVEDPDSYLVFHSPNLVYSFAHNNALEGYIIYFKPEAFSFFRPGFHQQFTLFDQLRTNLFRFNHDTFNRLAPHFETVFSAYEQSSKDAHLEARLKLLGLLCHLEEFAQETNQKALPTGRQQVLMRDFIQLIESHYIQKRSVKEYADLLSVTANYLSQSVKQASGRNALSFITERVATEAKSLIRYTDMEISGIAYQLEFSDPNNFGKFFKKHTGLSPSEFRRKHR
ncbi:helix-turn-helix domain-containing protein [Pedobacter sp. UC225_65]|uniref:helix-turn-helix domain-containing protein n=1 Tax=Pedobacter sp. UC225_65 TaxID=3350173 RepID=UPI00366CE079